MGRTLIVAKFFMNTLRQKEGSVVWPAIVTVTPLLVGILMVANVLVSANGSDVETQGRQEQVKAADNAPKRDEPAEVQQKLEEKTEALPSRFDATNYMEAEVMEGAEITDEASNTHEPREINDNKIRTYGNDKQQKNDQNRIRLDAVLKPNL